MSHRSNRESVPSEGSGLGQIVGLIAVLVLIGSVFWIALAPPDTLKHLADPASKTFGS